MLISRFPEALVRVTPQPSDSDGYTEPGTRRPTLGSRGLPSAGRLVSLSSPVVQIPGVHYPIQ